MQNAFLLCNYSTQYEIPENGGYYLYLGVDISIRVQYLLDPGNAYRVFSMTGGQWHNMVMRHADCFSRWRDRCTITGNQCVADCVSDDFTITVSDMADRDYDRYRCNLATDDTTYQHQMIFEGKYSFRVKCPGNI